MAALCNWYDCRERWRYETKTSGIDDVKFVWVNLIGATTPESLQCALPQEAISGGLTSRIVFAYGDKITPAPDPFIKRCFTGQEERLSHDLERICMMRGEFVPTDDFLPI